MLSLGVIEPSQSAWSYPVRLVVRPNKVRLCLDARKLNEAIKKDAHPLQNIMRIFARLPKANIISKLDLKDANITLNIAKRHFCVAKVNYLGYVIGSGGITTDPSKVSCIVNWPTSKNLKQVCGFLDVCGWYRRLIKNYSDITFPITEVLSSKKTFK